MATSCSQNERPSDFTDKSQTRERFAHIDPAKQIIREQNMMARCPIQYLHNQGIANCDQGEFPCCTFHENGTPVKTFVSSVDKNNPIPNSPSSLLKVIMNHVFKTSLIHRSSENQGTSDSKLSTGDSICTAQSDMSESILDMSLCFDELNVGNSLEDEIADYANLPKKSMDSSSSFTEQDFLYNAGSKMDSLRTYLQPSPCVNGLPLSDQDVINQAVSTTTEVLFAGDKSSSNVSNNPTPYVIDNELKRTCRLCLKVFTRKQNRDEHLANQSCIRAKLKDCLKISAEGWTCELCPTQFFNKKKEAKEHVASHQIPLNSCPVCQEIIEERVLKHMRVNHPDYLF